MVRTYRIKPRQPDDLPKYRCLTKQISLKKDLGWGEVKHLQGVLRGSEIWDNFPQDGVKLIIGETGKDGQRLDLVYVGSDGGVFPCELKIGGKSWDSHGQLIRYLASLNAQKINKQWILQRRKHFLQRSYRKTNYSREQRKQNIKIDLLEFEHAISKRENTRFRLLARTGVIIDEGFRPQVVEAVRFLNKKGGFSITLLEAKCFVAANWKKQQRNTAEYLMRFELHSIDC